MYPERIKAHYKDPPEPKGSFSCSRPKYIAYLGIGARCSFGHQCSEKKDA